jgi:two-component system, LytTR family, sensor kinase
MVKSRNGSVLTALVPLGATAAAALLGGATVAVLALWGRGQTRRRRLASAELDAKMAQLRLENLRAQLCPHFLFNALNAASALVTVDPEAAERMIAQISELLRIALRTEGVQKVRFESELSFVEKYLRVERMRFGGRLHIAYDIGEGASAALAPNFLLQPIVENAVHHGIAPRSEPGRIDIAARCTARELLITVRDDGPGLPPRASPRAGAIGLRSTRARLEHLYGDGFRFTLRNAPGGGVIAEVRIPYERAPARRAAAAGAAGQRQGGEADRDAGRREATIASGDRWNGGSAH